MIKKITLFIFLSFIGLLHSQSNYPTDYFIKPLEIPLVLSGTFGELRSNHFHAGLDIKTQQVTGHKVVAAADGYVSRIKISHWGYGKALYITHPNGYTTVYGHLKKFSPKIEAYVKKQQYLKKSYEIHLYPKSNELKLNKGELIALSGNSGSSGGPHLHFEIRDVKANILNPMLFGIQIADHKKPTIQSAFAYTKNDTSQVNQSNKNIELILKRQKNGDLIANTVYAHGEIGIGINAYDRLDGANNHNGLYFMDLNVNGKKLFEITFDKFSFSESRFINSYIDYERYARLNQKVQKCFVDHPMNKLSLYDNLKNKGFIHIKDSLDYKVTITTKDFKGNTTKLIIPIKGKKDTILIGEKVNKTPYLFKANQENNIGDDMVKVHFPKNLFYKDFYFDFSNENGVVKLHNKTVSVHSYFKITFDVSKYNKEDLKYMFIAKKNKSKKWYYVSTKHKNNTLYTSSKNLGEYTLLSDLEKPVISPFFKKDQWLTKSNYLKVKIYDKKTGIKSYRGEIDGQWILMEYDPKKNILTYDFRDKKFTGTPHTLKVIVKDYVNNSTTFTRTFNKKFN